MQTLHSIKKHPVIETDFVNCKGNSYNPQGFANASTYLSFS